MSIRVMPWVWDNAAYSGSELLALLAVADWCDDGGKTAFGPEQGIVANLACRIWRGVRATQYVLANFGWSAHGLKSLMS